MNRRLVLITEEEWLKRADAAHYCAQTLAEHCGVSISTLARHILSFSDQSPHDWLRGLRMALAKKRLEEGMKVACTARELRYQSEASFSRAFKEHCGYPPQEHVFRVAREIKMSKMNNLDMK